MFEGAVAGILNRILGKYVQDLDTENLNVGIFSGNVNLTDLKLKPEAFYELDLPIDVKIGTIGRVSLQIPWACLSSQPVVVRVEDVLALVGPAISNTHFDPEREKRLMRAAKRKILQDLEAEAEILKGPANFFSKLFTAVASNVQVYVKNVHIRYEDATSCEDGPLACGLCLQSLSIETTNSKWKPSAPAPGASTAYQLARVECLAIYWDPRGAALDEREAANLTPIHYYNWKHYMLTTRERTATDTDYLHYLVKPLWCKVKALVSAGRVLLDVLTPSLTMLLTRHQLLSAHQLLKSFHRIQLNRKYRHLHPGLPLTQDIRKWWLYAYKAVLEQRVRPYTWASIKRHRENYENYKRTYKSTLRSPNDTELKLDLQKCEDNLPIVSVVVAREHAKFEMLAQEQERIEVVESDYDWWETDNEGRRRVELCVRTERSRSLWSHLTSPERRRVCELIGYVEGEATQDKAKALIHHKLNLTLANCTISLINRNKEILTATLSQFLASLETRSSAKSYKLSARTESLVVEGASSDQTMVTILSGSRQGSSTGANHWLSVDLATGTSDADYSLACTIYQHTFLYNQYAFSELVNFFQTRSMTSEDLVEGLEVAADKAKGVCQSVMKYAISRKKLFSINIDIKGPRIIIPEYGCDTKRGRLMVIEVVEMAVVSELQPRSPALEHATCSEREELLYDRVHADCTVQVLFCSSSAPWLEKLKQHDSDLHLVPRVRAQLVFSNTIMKDYKLLPRYKLNISLSSVKLNLSDRIITSVLDFVDTLPLPTPTALPVFFADEWEDPPLWPEDAVNPDPGYADLVELRNRIVAAYFAKNRSPVSTVDRASARAGLQQAGTVFLSTEQSDEEMELYARSVDLPGFDDNVSPANNINTLLRFVVGEIVVNLSRSTEQKEKPYMTLAVSKVCLDVALMEYGPAVQLSVNQATLQHHSSATETLQLFSTEEQMFNLLYRKVRADCPDFKSHFHSVEQSLVADTAPVSVLLHADALRTAVKYLHYIYDKIQSRHSIDLKSVVVPRCAALWECLMRPEADPPVPSGATKFSYSIRASSVTVRLCNQDCSLLEARLTGLESDCVFRANDAFVFKLYLASLHVDYLSQPTLYPKLVWPDEDKVLELKYVVSAPRYAPGQELKPHGELRLYLGRCNILLFIHIVNQLQMFLEPLLPNNFISDSVTSTEKFIQQQLEGIRNWSTRINLFIELHAPVLLLPSKPSSPDLLVLNMGDLLIENFFKQAKSNSEATSPAQNPIIDNILIKLQNVTLSRAVMTLTGTLEVQEPILEPWSARCDIKRCVSYASSYGSRGLLLDASAHAERLGLALGQRDLAAAVALVRHNLSEPLHHERFSPSSPVEPQPSDVTVKKLQAFFQQGEPVRKEVVFRLTLEGIELKLFSDMDEILSSPVRDSNRGLARLDVNELSLQYDSYSDETSKLYFTLYSMFLTDISTQSNSTVKNIFESLGGTCSLAGISVRRAPLLEASVCGGRGGRAADVSVDRTRLNIAAPFCILLARTLLQAMPGDRTMDGGLVNHGYVGEVAPSRPDRHPSSNDSTSGYYSTATSVAEERPSLTVSIQFRQPEIMFMPSEALCDAHALLVRAELLVDYSCHSNTENLVVSLAGLQVMSKLQSKLRSQPPQMVLRPCDVEFSRSFKSMEEGVRVQLSVSDVEVHIAATTVQTVSDIIDEITSELTIPDEKEPFNFVNYTPRAEKEEELWSPRKLIPYLATGVEDSYLAPRYPCVRPSETFVMNVPRIKILLEAEHIVRVPLFVFKMSLESMFHDWSVQLRGSASLTLSASCFDDQLQVWQPLVEHTVQDGVLRPWTVTANVFQAKAYPLSSRLENKSDLEPELQSPVERESKARRHRNYSDTSPDEDGTDNEMTFIRNPHGKEKMDFNYGMSLLSTLEDSDSDNRQTDKLADAISQLFSDDSSEEESNKDADSSAPEQSDPDEPSEPRDEPNAPGPYSEHVKETKTVTLHEPARADSVDSGVEAEAWSERACTYVVLRCSPLAVSAAPAVLRAWSGARAVTADVSVDALVNDIGPGSTVHLVSDADGQEKILASADYDVDVSRPSTPGCDTSGADLLEDVEPVKKPDTMDITDDWDCFSGGFGASRPPPPALASPPPAPVRRPPDETLRVHVPGSQPLTILGPTRTVSKLHPLYPSKDNNTRYYIVVERTSKYNTKKIVVRSPLQIRNETSYALEVYYKRSELEAVGAEIMGCLANPFDDKMRVAVIAPQDTYNVPMYLAYHCRLSLLPTNYESQVSSSPGIWWAELAGQVGQAKDLLCPPREEGGGGFALRILTVEGVQSNKVTRAIPNFLIRVLPPLGIYNRLPYACDVYCLKNVKKDVTDSTEPAGDVTWHARIEAGDTCHTHSLTLTQAHVIQLNVNYRGRPWKGTFNLTPELSEKTVSMCTDSDTDGGGTLLTVSARAQRKLYCQLYLHAPYWVINNTGLPIQLKGSRSDTHHEVCSEPLLWAGGGRARGSSTRGSGCTLRVRAHVSAWSRAAPPRVGVGLLVCPHAERRISYRILMQVTLSELCPQLTKIITLLPYFLVYNDTRRHLRFMEEDEAADLWIDLAPHQCSPFWPQTDSMAMHVKYRDSTVVSQHFPITKNHFTVLRMDKGSAICVEVTGGTDRPFTVTFKSYTAGDAPIRIDNLCDDLFLKLHQVESGQVALLSPYQSLLYTWDDPNKPRELIWNIYNNKEKGFQAHFMQDGYGEEKVSFHSVKHSTLVATNSVTSKLSSTLKRLTPKSPEPCSSSSDDSDSTDPHQTKPKKMRKDKVTVYWISFMDGYQRVFALAQDERVAYQYRMRINSERSNFEVYLSLASVSLSACVQTSNGIKELAYCSITDSVPRWEVNVNHKWKQISPDLTAWIEESYQLEQKKCQLKEYLHVDLEKMQMTKPFFSELRRTYNPGIWLQLRKSDTLTYCHLKLNRIQIDNQLNEAVFPCVLYPAPLPLNARPKQMRPSLEILCLKQHRPTLNQDVYKYVKVLLQEHCINLDRGFVNYVFDILNQWKVEDKPAVRLRADLALVHMPLPIIAIKNQTNVQRNVHFEFVHLSPVKLMLSLSSRGYSAEDPHSPSRTRFGKKENRPKLFNSDFLEYLFNSWGSTVCDMKDIVLRLSYMEVKNAPITCAALLDAAYRHYSVQLIQQFYVLVLRLHVLGNPYTTTGDFLGEITNFYDPHLGRMVCPLGDGWSMRLSAGAARLLRQHACGVPPAAPVLAGVPELRGYRRMLDEEIIQEELPASLLEATYNNPASIFLTLTGLISTHTLDEDYIVVKNVCRHASAGWGAVCAGGGAGGARGALRAAAERTLVARRRLPRHCSATEGVSTYNEHSAVGSQLLSMLCRGHYADTDEYVAHAHIHPTSNYVLLVSTRHVLMVRAGGSSSGSWHVEWAVSIDDLIGVPTQHAGTLVLHIRQDELVNYFSTDEKVVEIPDPEVLAWLQAKIESAIVRGLEDKRCPAQ